MPATKVLKPHPVEAARNSLQRSSQKVRGAHTELQVPAARKSRASSCPRRDGTKPSCERRARSTSTAPRTTATRTRTNPDPPARRREVCAEQKERRSVRTESKAASQSHKAFTVIPPNPKKRREIQRKAEAELAALEELRLSRAMAYVSINPSSVGGCMSLEEVRSKQQQEMMQAKRKP
ncbi:hypothetical protein L3Q82_018356, partial [Scortum barcoo]